MSLITTMNNKAITLSSIVAIALLFSSCESEQGKEVVGFFVGFVIFMIGTVIVGIPSIVLSSVSLTSEKNTIPVLAIIFTVLYFIFFLISFEAFSDTPSGLDSSVAVFPVVNLAIIAMDIVFIVKGYKKRGNKEVSKADSKTSLLDDIINEEDPDDGLL